MHELWIYTPKSPQKPSLLYQALEITCLPRLKVEVQSMIPALMCSHLDTCHSDVRAKWYDIGMQLQVNIGTLKAIEKWYSDPSDCLREILTTWLKSYPLTLHGAKLWMP